MPIRRIRQDEGMRLKEIRIRLLSDSPKAFAASLEETLGMSDEEWAARAERSAVGSDRAIYVFEEDGAWRGIAGACFDAEEQGPPHLVSMWVDPSHRGQGLGRQLIDAVVAWAKQLGATQMQAWVTATNQSARALYTTVGFAPSGRSQPLPTDPTLVEEHLELSL